MKRIICADIETDGFNASKVYVLSACEVDPVTMVPIRSYSRTDDAQIKELIADPDITWVIHNGYSFDKIQLEKLIGTFAGYLVDSLGISWYLEPNRHLHGLASYGEEFGVPKPVVEDWIGLELSVYIDRCEEDVKIQTKLWRRQWKHLKLLYGDDPDAIWHCIKYLDGKMRALAIAQESKWQLKVDEATILLEEFKAKFDAAKIALEEGMPQVAVFAKKTRPKKPYLKNGGLSATGTKWNLLCIEHKKDFDFMGEIKHQTGWDDANAASYPQLKGWLFDLGWKPTIYDFKRNKDTGDMRKIPQIKNKDTGELCEDIARMAKNTPALLHLVEMSVVKHRMDVTNGFFKGLDEDDCIVAGAHGFTNTLRLRHKCALNIPSSRKPYGSAIRGLLTVKDLAKFELLGSDMCSLEDRIKMHYMFPHDPGYVAKMSKDDYDAHCTMAIAAGLMTEDQEVQYKDPDCPHDLKMVLGGIRFKGKGTNYAAQYGAGGPTIARSAGVEEAVGDMLHAAYWELNWSVKAIADECKVKESRGFKWLWNPVANMWYYLKVDKDRFSTLCQGTASFVFDRWVDIILTKRPQINGQFHDEIILEVLRNKRPQATKLLKDAIAQVNTECKLNVDLDVDVDFADTYAGVH